MREKTKPNEQDNKDITIIFKIAVAGLIVNGLLYGIENIHHREIFQTIQPRFSSASQLFP